MGGPARDQLDASAPAVNPRRRDALLRLHALLADDALHSRPPAAAYERFCQELSESGLAIRRAQMGFALLHPQVRSRTFTYRRGAGVSEATFGHEPVAADDGWTSSPFHHLITSGVGELRHRLRTVEDCAAFRILAELFPEGVTDYFAAIRSFHWNVTHIEGGQMGLVSSFACDAPEGFSDEDLAFLRAAMTAMAASFKTQVMEAVAHDVLAAYVGRDAARRALGGSILRGVIVELQAVLLFADLQGFTRYSLAHPPAAVVELLDTTFDAVTEAVTAEGGEILKFLGDGLLAVFLLDGGRGTGEAVDAALRAALHAQQKLRSLPGGPPLPLDMAVHIGPVEYGNVGAANRLDFTVVGPCVNAASRLEKLCETLRQPIVVSPEVRAVGSAMTERLVDCGSHEVRDLGRLPIFALPVDEDREEAAQPPASQAAGDAPSGG